jgi:hypothetical protein
LLQRDAPPGHVVEEDWTSRPQYLSPLLSRRANPVAAETSDTTHAGQGLDRAASPRPPRLGLALVVISLAQLMLVLDELIVNTALPGRGFSAPI